MLRIRFLRVGKKNRPSFRLVVTPRRSATKTGKFLELLGFYDPIKHVRKFKKDRIQYWLSKGASASDSAHNMLISEGIIEGEKVAVHKKAKKKNENEDSTIAEGDDGIRTPEVVGEEKPTEEKKELEGEEAQDAESKDEGAEEAKEEKKPEEKEQPKEEKPSPNKEEAQ